MPIFLKCPFHCFKYCVPILSHTQALVKLRSVHSVFSPLGSVVVIVDGRRELWWLFIMYTIEVGVQWNFKNELGYHTAAKVKSFRLRVIKESNFPWRKVSNPSTRQSSVGRTDSSGSDAAFVRQTVATPLSVVVFVTASSALQR